MNKTDFVFFHKSNRKSLKVFDQGSNMIRLTFIKALSIKDRVEKFCGEGREKRTGVFIRKVKIVQA